MPAIAAMAAFISGMEAEPDENVAMAAVVLLGDRVGLKDPVGVAVAVTFDTVKALPVGEDNVIVVVSL